MELHRYLHDSARYSPGNIAVQDTDGHSITYSDLDRLANQLCDRLLRLGLRPGDRVGFWMRKSINAVATIFGVLKAGGAYVPVDPTAPALRNGYIFADCAVSVIITESRFEAALRAVLRDRDIHPEILVVEESANISSRRTLDEGRAGAIASALGPAHPNDLAYILYTSGSTGRPKGVQLTHRNAVAFIEWCSETFDLTCNDRFSSHAPLHFDLSILDVFCCIKHRATLVLISEEVSKKPRELAQLIADMKLTIWYSAPSILSLMSQYGQLDIHTCSSLRLVLFAGEVFPISHLRALTRHWPHPRFFNLYGPTETNVCTYCEVQLPIPENRTEPMPIGEICSHLEGVVVDADGLEVKDGAEGELCIRGPAVTRGYWNLADQTITSFITVGTGEPYYRTGDLVREDPDHKLRYLGRKDRMIKKRGYRVELGEIEACLYQHPGVREAAVVASPDDGLGMRVHAHLASVSGDRISLIELKSFCSERVPLYMIPDLFSFHETLPKTSTDKVDYQTLKAKS